MDRLFKILPLVVATLAVILVFFQRRELKQLRTQLEEVSTSTLGTERDPDSSAVGHVPTQRGMPALERRVASLEQTMARIFRLQLGEKRAPGSSGEAPPVERTEVSALREDVDALLTGEALNTEKGREQLHQVVRKVQEQLHQERSEQRQQLRQELQRQRLDRLAKETNLSPAQVERLNTTLTEERGQRRAIMQAARRGERPIAQAVKEVRVLRQATDEQARQLLDSKQYTAYEKMRSEGRGGRRGQR